MSNRWIQTPDVTSEQIDSQTLLVSAAKSKCYVLNAAAAHVWRACRNGASIGEMARSLAGKARGTAAAIEREVSALCASLSAEGLLKPCAAGAGSVAAFTGFDATPSLTIRSLAGRGGRRPTPRGNSGPG